MISILRLVGLLGTVAVATLSHDIFSVTSTSICTMHNTMLPPPTMGGTTVYVEHVAWQLGGPPMAQPLTINGARPSGDPALICMGGCSMPPCLPVSSCSPPDLWWAVPYENLTLMPGWPATLPDIVGGPPIPPILMVLYDDSAPIPSPRRTIAATPYPAAAPVAVAAPTLENPHATPAAITLGILLGGAMALLAGCWRWNRRTECPYCLIMLGKGHLRVHLDECKAHLERFTPVVLERVRVVRQTVHAHGGSGSDDEKEDLVARPELVTARA
jgi:hypothetical protein